MISDIKKNRILLDSDKEIFKILEFSNTKAICRVGSTVTNSEFKDIDYLIISENIEQLSRDILELFKNFYIIKLDDSFRIKHGELIYNLAIFNEIDFLKKIEDILEGKILGEHREWTIGYWLPEGLLFDLLNSLIIYDDYNILQKIKVKIDSNYKEFLEKITLRITQEVEFSLGFSNKYRVINEIKKNSILLSLLRFFNLSFDKRLINFEKMLDSALNSELKKEFTNLLENQNLMNKYEINKILEKCQERIPYA